MIVASGISSASLNANPPPPVRILEMVASPEASAFTSKERERGAAETSSPVEEFSSPAKPSQVSEVAGSLASGYAANEDSELDRTPYIARVGTWQVPDIRERPEMEIDIDPNGDDDLVAGQVQSIVAQEKERKRRRLESERPPSSMPSQESYVGPSVSSLRIPRNSTPPPKRQRRGRHDEESAEKLSPLPAPSAQPPNEKQSDDSQDLSDLGDPTVLLSDPLSEASSQAIVRYVRASPLIPNFLKEEIIRCVIFKSAQSTQSQGSKSDSDTQEDGYLKTKPFWLFELLRINNGKVTAGNGLTSEVHANDSTMCLHIISDVLSYGLQMLERVPLMMSRNEARTNPWFDGHGHPFSIVYQKLHTLHNEASTSVLTQASAEQLSLLQSEIEQLSEEKRAALIAQEEAEKKCRDALAASLSTQEDNDFLREQYAEASNMATKLAKSTTQLEEEVAYLKQKLSTGLETVRAFSRTRIETLETKLKVTQGSLNLLVQQNRLTDDLVRKKAAEWDTYQAKKKAKDDVLEKRRAEIDEESAAIYRALEEEDRRRAIEANKAPHVRFLEIDLADQKETIEGLEPEEDDEVAMLRAEAGEAALDVNVGAPRPSRRRAAASNTTSAEQEIIAKAIAGTQEQAQSEMADVLLGELAYQDATTHKDGEEASS
jgi:hypothetical protein